MRLKEIRLGHFAKISLFGLKTLRIKGKTSKSPMPPSFSANLNKRQILGGLGYIEQTPSNYSPIK
jgi:hypothetical protein